MSDSVVRRANQVAEEIGFDQHYEAWLTEYMRASGELERTGHLSHLPQTYRALGGVEAIEALADSLGVELRADRQRPDRWHTSEGDVS